MFEFYRTRGVGKRPRCFYEEDSPLGSVYAFASFLGSRQPCTLCLKFHLSYIIPLVKRRCLMFSCANSALYSRMRTNIAPWHRRFAGTDLFSSIWPSFHADIEFTPRSSALLPAQLITLASRLMCKYSIHRKIAMIKL